MVSFAAFASWHARLICIPYGKCVGLKVWDAVVGQCDHVCWLLLRWDVSAFWATMAPRSLVAASQTLRPQAFRRCRSLMSLEIRTLEAGLQRVARWPGHPPSRLSQRKSCAYAWNGPAWACPKLSADCTMGKGTAASSSLRKQPPVLLSPCGPCELLQSLMQ